MRKIWLCADDYAIAPAVDAAIRDLLTRGRLNATSVMAVAPSFSSEAPPLAALNRAAPAAWVRQCGSALPLRILLQDFKTLALSVLSRGFRRRAAALGLKTNPAFAGVYDLDPETDFAALFPRFLEGLPEGGLVMCHPGHVDAELRGL